MAIVLVKGAIIQCPHSGQMQLGSGDGRLTVGGNGVVTSGMEAGLTFGSPITPVPGMVSPCQAQTPNKPPAYAPCVTSPARSGLATKLAVGGLPALLDTAGGLTVSGEGPGKWSVSSPGQAKLEAV
jgi:hypothetical protein